MNERNWFRRSIFNSGKKGLVSIRYKLGITPEERLFIESRGEEKENGNVNDITRGERNARARAGVNALLQVKRILQAEPDQVKPGCGAGSGCTAVRGYPALCISFPVTLRRHEGETPHPSRGNFAVWSFASGDSCIRLNPAAGQPAAATCFSMARRRRGSHAIAAEITYHSPAGFPADRPFSMPPRLQSLDTHALRILVTSYSCSNAAIRCSRPRFTALRSFLCDIFPHDIYNRSWK